MTYDEVVAHLDALQMHKIKLGLEAMQNFLSKVGRPENDLKFVHVAGTNGKGSVCTAVADILGSNGYRVGVFTSPHLSSVRERFRVSGSTGGYISREDFARLGKQIIDVLAGDHITYFEFTTALALLWFREQKVDLVMLETGMGGRLDATNVVTPLVAVITSISMDHEMYLGDTLAKIAGEKAGIIKPGVPVVSGATAEDAADVVAKTAQSLGAPLYQLCRDFDYTRDDDGSWSWQGGERLSDKLLAGIQSSRLSLVQQDNDSLAVAVLVLLKEMGFTADDDCIKSGLANAVWPGRMECFEREFQGKDGAKKTLHFLLDGAHNPDGVKNLAETVGRKFRYRRLLGLWGAMGDKDLTSTLGTIAPLLDVLMVTKPAGDRSATPEMIINSLPSDQREKAIGCPVVAEALHDLQEMAGEDDLVMVGGSLYLLGEVRTLLLGELA